MNPSKGEPCQALRAVADWSFIGCIILLDVQHEAASHFSTPGPPLNDHPVDSTPNFYLGKEAPVTSDPNLQLFSTKNICFFSKGMPFIPLFKKYWT